MCFYCFAFKCLFQRPHPRHLLTDLPNIGRLGSTYKLNGGKVGGDQV